jgi:serine/threonine protein kinase/lipopolysaccharide biosynthesis regulator YciM
LVSEEISHYRIIKKLGAGGMGEVFLAEDIRLNRKVAIKMLPSRSIGNEHAKKRLFREARAAATLDHPNICAIHEVGEEGDCAFIVMQYIEGETLSCSIQNNPLSALEIADIGIQAAAALAEAHSHGIIHRDIKPQNMIVTPRGQVKILDFGLAKIFEDERAMHKAEADSRLTDTGEVLGTVGYMSPEQLKDLPIDARSDLFSLGVTLYECATGKAAFSGSSRIQICLQVIQFDPPRPSHLNPDIPFELDNVILKALAKDAEARYQSAAEMLADLSNLRAALQDGSAFNTRPLTPAPGSFRPPAAINLAGRFRKASFRAKVGLLLVPLVIIGVLAAIRISQSSPYQPSPDAKRWYDRGTTAIREGAYYQASKALESAVSLDDKFALAHARLAEAYVEIDYTDRAMEELIRAISLVRDRAALPNVDAMYLDAIEATVRRDFASAIDYYRKIAERASDSGKASAYVDLGRSYEKNENIDKAIEHYTEAANADPQSATAFLRLAILYGRRQDLKNATEAFDKAEEIYHAMSNQEGVAEVLYQRGTLFSKIRKLAEAKIQLEKALEISQTSADNKYQLVRTQLQLSSVYYAEGNTERAKDIATKAIGLAEQSNIRNLATNGMIDLGYTLVSRGEFNEAGKYFTQALNFARVDKARRTEARAKMGLGSVIVQQGNPDEAIVLLQEALDFYQPAGYRKETSIALVLLGRAHRNKGEYEIALKIFEQELQLAKELGDPAQIVASHSSIAILLGVEQEKYAEALPHLNESYKINEAIGAKVGMVYDLLNRGLLLWQLGRYREARADLDSAFSIADQPEASYKAVLAWVHLANSQMALSERRFAEAKAKGQQSLGLAGTQYPDVVLQAKLAIGLAQALSGAPQPARRLCEEAVAAAKELNNPRLISSSLLALAEVLLLGNDAPRALATSLQAQAMFARSGQQDSEWRAWLMAARASQLGGDKSTTQEYASRADSQCAGLQQKWGAEAYDGYLRRPDIQAYRKQMAKILTRSK